MSGKSILASGTFQQSTRNRNIKKLYFYSTEQCAILNQYSSLEDTEEQFSNLIVMDDKIHNICIANDANDDEILNKNTFFKLFCYNEYTKQILKLNMVEHYMQFLRNAGFTVIDNANKEDIIIPKYELELMKKCVEEYNEDLFQEYLDTPNDERSNNIKFNFIEEIKIDFQINGDKNLIELYPILSDHYKKWKFSTFKKCYILKLN